MPSGQYEESSCEGRGAKAFQTQAALSRVCRGTGRIKRFFAGILGDINNKKRFRCIFM